MNDDVFIFADEIPWRSQPLAYRVFTSELATPDERGMLYADVVALELHLAAALENETAYRDMVQAMLEEVGRATLLVARLTARVRDQENQIRRLMGRADDASRGDASGT